VEAVVGFGAAVDYLERIGLQEIENHDRLPYTMARFRLRDLPGARILGPPPPGGQAGPLSFTIAGTPSHVLARALSDSYGICARSGFHCAEPLHEQCKLPATVRLSVYLYNQPEEIDQFFDALATITAFGSPYVVSVGWPAAKMQERATNT
jgi:cysteine desulfurase / selenocysteine lyase